MTEGIASDNGEQEPQSGPGCLPFVIGFIVVAIFLTLRFYPDEGGDADVSVGSLSFRVINGSTIEINFEVTNNDPDPVSVACDARAKDATGGTIGSEVFIATPLTDQGEPSSHNGMILIEDSRASQVQTVTISCGED